MCIVVCSNNTHYYSVVTCCVLVCVVSNTARLYNRSVVLRCVGCVVQGVLLG